MSSAVPPPQSGNKYSVSVLSTHSTDSSPSLLVTFPDQRYLFNTPEAISRIALQSKLGLRKVGKVFLGSVEESAGLPGFILSSVEAGNSKIEVVGPAGTDHYLASCRFFTRRDKLSLKVSSPEPADSSTSSPPSLPAPIHTDSNLNVFAFPLTASVPLPDTDSTLDSQPTSPSSSLKRKRSQSRSPPPRPKSPPFNSEGSSKASSPRPLDPGSPSFQPSRLLGKEAEEWRSMVIRDMFRGRAFDPTETAGNSADSNKGETRSRERKGPTPAYLPQSLPQFTGTKEAISYLAVGPVQIGKFLPAEASRLGVKPGQSFAKLKSGQRVWVRPEVKSEAEDSRAGESKKDRMKRVKAERAKQQELEKTLVDGEGEGFWVEPEQCMEEGQDASAFLVLNIPSPEFLPSLASTIPSSLLARDSLGPTTTFCAIFYLLGPGVLNDSRFQNYLSSLRKSLPSSVQHRVTSADHVVQGKDEVTFGPSALLNLRLSKLDDEIFHVPKYSFNPNFESSPPTIALSTLSSNSHFISSTSLAPSSVSPLGGEIRSFNFALGSQDAETEASRLKGLEKPQEVQDRGSAAWDNYLQRVQEVKPAVLAESEKRGSEMDQESGLKVTPLGTGSAIPSKYRNVSSTLIHIPKSTTTKDEPPEEYILLDAGEGTWGQLARRFGIEQAREVLRNTKMIFISHLHQDHHAGLSTLLRERARLSPHASSPLTIVAPSNARTYLFEQHQLLNLGLYSNNVRFIDNFLLEPGKELQEGSRTVENYRDLLALLGLEAVVAVPVLHRCRAWGVVISGRNGWRVVFSGDTMPCDALVEHGQGASLLIHEATIEDELPEVAHAKGHSTFAQAIDIAVRMRARHLLLTHFSARYPKLPPKSSSSSSSESSHQPVIATAFDLMTLRLSDFWKMEYYREALDALLSWDEADEGKETVE